MKTTPPIPRDLPADVPANAATEQALLTILGAFAVGFTI